MKDNYADVTHDMATEKAQVTKDVKKAQKERSEVDHELN